MHIFVDESGNFVTRNDGSAVAAVGALVVTENQTAEFERRYAQLRPLLPKQNGEVKGRLLGESDVARVVDVARRSGLIYEVDVLDLPADSAADIEAHRAAQCEGLTRKLTPEHHPNAVASIYALRRTLEAMPVQLYAQCTTMFDLLWRTLKHATIYYSQREPPSLARFRWVVDAKGSSGLTPAEEWWSVAVRPMLQSRSIDEPFPQIEGGDYSHLAAVEGPMPEYLVKELPRLKDATGLRIDSAFTEIEFRPEPLPGLEVVDVVTNAVRRALTGRLDVSGYAGVAGLMIHRKGGTYVQASAFTDRNRKVPEPDASVLRQLGRGGRPMLSERWKAEVGAPR